MMTIQNRILLLVTALLSFALIAIITGLSIMKSNNTDLQNLYYDRIVPLQELKNVSVTYTVFVVDTTHQLRNGNLTWQQAKENIQTGQAVVKKIWAGYQDATFIPEEAELADKVRSAMLIGDQETQKLLNFIERQDMAGVTEFSIHQLYPAITPIFMAVSDLFDFQLREAEKHYQMKQESYQSTFWMVIAMALLILMLAIVFSRKILIAITRPLNNLVCIARQVQTEGNLSLRATVTHQDEVGQVSTAFNALLESVAQGIADANRVVSAMASSNFNERVMSDYQGDLNTLKQGINHSADSVAFMMSELEKVMKSLSQGQFDAKMDSHVPVAFRQQVENALASINHIIVDISHVMSQINLGEFDARVTSDASGQLLTLKQTINSAMNALEKAIEETVFNIEAIACGDLTHTITNEYQGQLLRLKNSINQSNRKLSEVVTKALTATSVVSGAAEEVSQGSITLSQRVQENAAAAEETSATMDEMRVAVVNNTEHAKQATRVAHEVQEKSNQGVKVMQQTIDAMNAIQQSSHKISDIVSLIDGIAFQTNLLALNAAVEAARAGDHGRGFAVVAGEVRSLAQKAAEAAKAINHLISESVARIDDGTKLATASGEVLGTISQSVNTVTQMIEQIAEASSLQMAGIQQANTAITQIDEGTQQNAALVEETSAASQSLSEQARLLQQDMAFFKTSKTTQANPLPPKVAPQPKMATNIQGLTQATAVSSPKKVTPASNADDWGEF